MNYSPHPKKAHAILPNGIGPTISRNIPQHLNGMLSMVLIITLFNGGIPADHGTMYQETATRPGSMSATFPLALIISGG